MSTSDLVSGAIARLNDKELEVLRLLAAGHTVKSIALRVGRSETSINERLRDARRKTGVGSSRELARLVVAQKNWDKNFDLSAPDNLADVDLQPAKTGRSKSKGTIIMITAISIAIAGFNLMAADSVRQTVPRQQMHAAATRPPPLVGRWSLDVNRIPAEERPQKVVVDFRMAPDQKWTTHVEIAGPDGSNKYADSVAATDGIPVRVTGNMEFIDTVSLRHPAPDTLVMTLGKDGAPVSTRVYTVSKDGKSMTETIIWAGNSVPKLETTYFKRID